MLALILSAGCGEASAGLDAAAVDAAVARDAEVARMDAGTDGGGVPPEDAAAPLDGGGDDAALPDAGAPDAGDPGTPVHLRPQSKSEILLFDPAVDRGATIGYHSFRIPALARVGGTLIAFAEGRQCGAQDFGNINLVMKRSTDDGRTWGALEEVEGRGPGTWGNPTPVVDATTGRLFLFMSWNDGDVSQSGGTNPCTGEATRAVGVGDRRVYLTWTDDEGDHWTDPVDLTATLQASGTTWDAMGPGIGIQTTVADPGRLVVPAIRRNIFSDDHGTTWRWQRLPSGTSEGTVAELVDGTLLRNDRAVGSVWDMAHRRWLSRGSIDATMGTDATGFEAFAPHDTLLDPRVEGSSLRYTESPHRLLFLNPASTVSRCRMRVRVSYDGGLTWPISRQLHDGLTADETCALLRGGYSSMIKTGDFHVAALVERGGAQRSLELHRFNLPWLLDGTPEPLP